MTSFPLLNDAKYLTAGSMPRVPENVSFLASQPDAKLPLSEIRFLWHPEIQHIAIHNFQPPSYYEDYLMTATYSDKMQELQRSQAEKLCKLHDSESGPRSFVEIGCGDGSFMKYAKQRIMRVVGIEPSERFAREAIKQGFDILIGYVGTYNNLTEEKFDSFVSRQVFEHLPDPVDVLRGIRRMLNPGAVGLIEVPNGRRALRLGRFFEFFPDHVNYYSVNSLVALASTAGLNAISCSESFSGDYLELWLRNDNDPKPLFDRLLTNRTQVCDTLVQKVTEITLTGQSVAIWGCGAKTLCILAECSTQLNGKVCYIVDSDPHKHGRYVPNTNIKVISPTDAEFSQPDVVLILALSYREEIAALVRQKLTLCKELLTLDDHGCIREI